LENAAERSEKNRDIAGTARNIPELDIFLPWGRGSCKFKGSQVLQEKRPAGIPISLDSIAQEMYDGV
jgi:hypothetical protein